MLVAHLLTSYLYPKSDQRHDEIVVDDPYGVSIDPAVARMLRDASLITIGMANQLTGLSCGDQHLIYYQGLAHRTSFIVYGNTE
jgi:hypothetical protein